MNKINVRIPPPLRKLTNNQDTVEVFGNTVSDVISNLNEKYNGIHERLCDENGNIRRFINIFLNDEDIRFLREKETPVYSNDELSIIPAIAGG